MPSNNAKITAEQRNEILRAFCGGNYEIVQARVRALNLASNYASKLARSRGLLPRTSKRWGQLRENT